MMRQGAQCSWAAVPSLGTHPRSRDAPAPEFCRKHLCRVGKGAERRAHAVQALRLHRVGFASLSPPYNAHKKKGKRNADRRFLQPAVQLARPRAEAQHARLSAFHRGSSRGRRNAPVQLQARLPGTRHAHAKPGSKSSCATAGTAGNSARRALPAPAYPSPVMHLTDRS
jgi:hypothetical protein